MASTPRAVPKEVRRAALSGAPPLFLAFFGGAFLAFGSFFVWKFFPWTFYRAWQLDDGSAIRVVGRIDSVADAKMQINHRHIMRYEFSFQPAAGAAARGTCFTTGPAWQRGAQVTVRYLPENPAICCVDGARMSAGSAGSLVVLVFPAAGAAIMGWTLVARRRVNRLLESGLLAEAAIVAVDSTNVRINNRYVWKITLRRTDAPESATFVVRTSQPEAIAFAGERMKADQLVFALYDPARPKRALLPEPLGGAAS